MSATRDRFHHGNLEAALREAALARIRTDGPHRFSLRGAARDVGVDVAAVYRHYPDKDGLLRAVARLGFVALAARIEADQAGVDGADPRLRAVGRAYVRYATDEPELFRLMFGPHGAGGDRPLFDDDAETPYRLLLASLDALADEGRCALPPGRAAAVLWSAVHGLATLVVDGPLSADAASGAIEDLLEVQLAGLAGRKPHAHEDRTSPA